MAFFEEKNRQKPNDPQTLEDSLAYYSGIRLIDGWISYPFGSVANNNKWRDAYAAARGARFEHGEQGA